MLKFAVTLTAATAILCAGMLVSGPAEAKKAKQAKAPEDWAHVWMTSPMSTGMNSAGRPMKMAKSCWVGTDPTGTFGYWSKCKK